MPTHHTSWRSISLLSSHLPLDLPSGLFPLGFPTKILYTSLFFHIHSTYPAHLILLSFIARIIFGEQYRSLNSSLCNLLHSPVTAFPLGPDIFPSTLFSTTLNLRSFASMTDQNSHSHKTSSRIIHCLHVYPDNEGSKFESPEVIHLPDFTVLQPWTRQRGRWQPNRPQTLQAQTLRWLQQHWRTFLSSQAAVKFFNECSASCVFAIWLVR